MATLEVRRCAGASELLSSGGGLLLAREALHARLVAAANRLRDEPDDDVDLLMVVDAGQVVAAGLRTPSWPLQVSQASAAATRALAQQLASDRRPVHGVIGPVKAAESFAAAWSRITGVAATVSMTARIFACTRVRPSRGVSGALRRGHQPDHGLLVEWLTAFHLEAVPDDPLPDVDGLVTRWLAVAPDKGGFWLWEIHGRAVAMAATTDPTPNAIRVLFVYTPPDLRARGYASGLVTAVTQQQLARGRAMVVLSADLANPTSNRIYRAIGYKPVADERKLLFHDAAS